MNDNEHSSDSATRRLARFRKRPEILRVAERRADWLQSDNGAIVSTQLAGYAMTRLAGHMSRKDYMQSISKLAATSDLPFNDFKLIAKCVLEQVRCMLSGSGQIPFTPACWDEEDGED